MVISLDMIQSIGLAIVLLMVGKKLKEKIKFLEKYCIPAPVIGGLIFAIISLILRQFEIVTFDFDITLQKFFMTMFFTSVGFNASLKVLKKGGIQVILFLFVATGLIFSQNILSIVLAKPLGIDEGLALMTGSTALTGGHGTSASIAPLIANTKATSIAIASATYGLIAGSIIGGPISRQIILKYNLFNKQENIYDEIEEDVSFLDKSKILLSKDKFSTAFLIILISMALGTLMNKFFVLIGIKSLPYYLGSMIIAAIIRNFNDYYDKIDITPMEEINILQDISLNLFLAMALMNLRLWDLIDLAIPVTILLIAQTILIAVYVRFITFNFMGKNYDAAIIVAGHCGFGMGATPNGITNMQTVCNKYRYSKLAFFTVPLVGALFIDFVNVSIITFFITYLK